ncbi:MAG: tRNA epoxyqueuosine(34) reductase QueG [Bacteroidales bacterium]
MLQDFSDKIKQKAICLGFSYCGIAKITPLEKESSYLKEWLEKSFHGEMQYMENHFEKRTNPASLIENAKSVISVLLNYFPSNSLEESDNYKIAKYAYGKDYHFIVKSRLNSIIELIQAEFPDAVSRAFCDSAPVMDKVWAERSGLGWIGKNTLLTTPKAGSFFLIGEIITDVEFCYDTPIKDHCGNCTRCMDACPAQAIVAPYQLDARKCISYQTIEYKNDLSSEMKMTQNDWIFGCDICQDVCPWNVRFAKPNQDADLQPGENLLNMRKHDWQQLSKPDFIKLFKNTALERTGYLRLKRNIADL